MLTPTLRTGSELSSQEKADIITRMFATQNQQDRDSTRNVLVEQYGISEWTITSMIARETMRRNKKSRWIQGSSQEWEVELSKVHWEERDKNPTQVVQNTTQTRVYVITSLVEITEQMRKDIIEEFSGIIQNNATNSRYDFYQDIEAISDQYNIDPNVLEQFLRNRYGWLWAKLDELKNGKVLSEEDKLNIRLYVSEWIDEKDKKKRRKEMSQRYGVSTYVIWAITAWKLGEDGWVVLKKDEIWDMNKWDIDEADSSWLIDWVKELPVSSESDKQSWQHDWDGSTPEASLVDQDVPLPTEQTLDGWIAGSLMKPMNEWENTLSEDDVAFIQELAWSFGLDDDKQRRVFLDDVFELFPDANIDDIKKIIPDFPDDAKHVNTKRSGEWMWALVNYNNEIKNKWRQKLKEFIDENTDKEKRATMKVLCLPGIECLEIPLYLELWFKPENIVWVEAWIVKGKKDPDIIARFQVNAAIYWIQTRIWKLEKVLETEETVFDVVSLDFLGPFSSSFIKVLASLKANKRVLVLTNFLAKREQTISKYLIHTFSVPSKIWEVFKGSVSNGQSVPVDLFIKTYTDMAHQSRDQNPLKDIRLEGIQGSIELYFWRWDNFEEKSCNFHEFTQFLQSKLNDASRQYCSTGSNKVIVNGKPLLDMMQLANLLSSILRDNETNGFVGIVESQKRYIYTSSTFSGTKFLSNFSVLTRMVNMDVPEIRKICQSMLFLYGQMKQGIPVSIRITSKSWKVNLSRLSFTDWLYMNSWKSSIFISFIDIMKAIAFIWRNSNQWIYKISSEKWNVEVIE